MSRSDRPGTARPGGRPSSSIARAFTTATRPAGSAIRIPWLIWPTAASSTARAWPAARRRCASMTETTPTSRVSSPPNTTCRHALAQTGASTSAAGRPTATSMSCPATRRRVVKRSTPSTTLGMRCETCGARRGSATPAAAAAGGRPPPRGWAPRPDDAVEPNQRDDALADIEAEIEPREAPGIDPQQHHADQHAVAPQRTGEDQQAAVEAAGADRRADMQPVLLRGIQVRPHVVAPQAVDSVPHRPLAVDPGGAVGPDDEADGDVAARVDAAPGTEAETSPSRSYSAWAKRSRESIASMRPAICASTVRTMLAVSRKAARRGRAVIGADGRPMPPQASSTIAAAAARMPAAPPRPRPLGLRPLGLRPLGPRPLGPRQTGSQPGGRIGAAGGD